MRLASFVDFDVVLTQVVNLKWLKNLAKTFNETTTTVYYIALRLINKEQTLIFRASKFFMRKLFFICTGPWTFFLKKSRSLIHFPFLTSDYARHSYL